MSMLLARQGALDTSLPCIMWSLYMPSCTIIWSFDWGFQDLQIIICKSRKLFICNIICWWSTAYYKMQSNRNLDDHRATHIFYLFYIQWLSYNDHCKLIAYPLHINYDQAIKYDHCISMQTHSNEQKNRTLLNDINDFSAQKPRV